METKKNNSEYIYNQLLAMFPNAKCELNHDTNFQLLIAVILSAQTTDISVNKVTPILFNKYPDAKSLANADINDVENCIKQIGLYKTKAKNIVNCAKQIDELYNGEIVNDQSLLKQLPGVGQKTSNVVLAECFNYPTIAVDTHVNRVSKRLKIAQKKDDLETVENKLKKYFPKERWIKMHHLFIFFGRYKCHSKNPECASCPFINFCEKDNY